MCDRTSYLCEISSSDDVHHLAYNNYNKVAEETLMTCGNFLTNMDFHVTIPKLSGVQMNVQQCTLPGLTATAVRNPTPFVDMKLLYDRVEFETLSMTSIIDSEMANYIAVYEWARDIGFPVSGAQRERLKNSKGGETSPISVMVLTPQPFAKPVAEFVFYGAFPISIGSMQMDITQTAPSPVKVDFGFDYTYYEVRNTWN